MKHQPKENNMSTITLPALYDLAPRIEREGRGKSWYAYAKPYVEALYSLETANDNYYADTGRSIVSYALANLGQWRGDEAREVKSLLKLHLK
jgi:hypothetical protein